jgi:ProP effector
VSEEFRTINALIRLCADQFPAVFTLERWKAHLPLAIGIDKALIATGILKPFEAAIVLNSYTRRRCYQVALAKEGAYRYDLDGNPAGKVSEEHRACAKALLARMDELTALAAAQVRAERKLALKAARAAVPEKQQPPLVPSSLTTPGLSTTPPAASEFSSTPPTTSETPAQALPEPPQRLSLEGLRAAAKARRAAQAA